MTPTATAARPGGPSARIPGGHRHAWGSMRFELVNDRPMVREACLACGMVRRYRAWERYWTPGSPEVRR